MARDAHMVLLVRRHAQIMGWPGLEGFDETPGLPALRSSSPGHPTHVFRDDNLLVAGVPVQDDGLSIIVVPDLTAFRSAGQSNHFSNEPFLWPFHREPANERGFSPVMPSGI